MPENEVGDLIITIRATAENLEAAAEEAKERLRGIGTAADQTKKPLKDAGQAGKDAGSNIKAGAQEAQLAWLALATVAVTVFKKIGEAVNQGDPGRERLQGRPARPEQRRGEHRHIQPIRHMEQETAKG